jgi:hypothetical protein
MNKIIRGGYYLIYKFSFSIQEKWKNFRLPLVREVSQYIGTDGFLSCDVKNPLAHYIRYLLSVKDDILVFQRECSDRRIH